MKTITQFNIIQLKTAKQAHSQAKSSAPSAPPTPVAPAAAPDSASTDEAAAVQGAEATDTPVEATSEAAPEAAAPPASPQAEGSDKKPAAPSLSPEALTALGEELKLDEKKVGLLVQSLDIIGKRFDRVRQVRVVESEGAPEAAVKKGEVAFILDMLPEPARKHRPGDKDAKGGRGKRDDKNKRGKGRGGDRDKRGGPGGPGGDKRDAGARRDAGPGAGKKPGGPGPGGPGASRQAPKAQGQQPPK